VRVEDRLTGEHYSVSARCVVSAAGARNTCLLLDAAAARPWQQELAKLPAGVGTLLLFVGLDRSPAAFGLCGENHWFMPDIDDDAGMSRPLGDGILFISFSSLNNPAARSHTVEVMHFVDPMTFRNWSGTDEATRPDDYVRLKAEVTERLIARLDSRWPGFRESVAFAELATPLSFKTYQNSADGSFYGLASSPERLRSPIARCRTTIKGLYLSGQDAWNAGIEAALWGGIMTANAVLTAPQILRMWWAIRSPSVAPDPSMPWRGYLRVSRIEPLTPSVKRFRLEPLRGGALPFQFRAGQYITLDLPVADDTIERSYSITSGPAERGFIEIAVKREAHGLGSTFLHDELAAGDALRLSAPFGDFILDSPDDIGGGRLLLIAGGVGITPIMSVLGAAADAAYRGPITFLASFPSKAEILFGEEIEAAAKRLPGLHVSIHLTAANESGSAPGRIDAAALRPHVKDVSRVHLCGPTPMMQAIIGLLTELAVPREAIHTEAFVSSRSAKTRSENAQAIAIAAREAGIAGFRIGVDGGATFSCRPGQTLLDAANLADIPFQQSCHEGACGKCRARVLSGRHVTDGQALFSDAEIAAGWVLACQTLPQANLEIRLPPPLLPVNI
jgi:ferredoxin-NADP reductase